MLRRLRICNFKGWEDTGWIEIAPITLFIGSNSSGKSSIGQSLLLLKRTVEEGDELDALHFGGEGAVPELGSFGSALFRRGGARADGMEFEYEWDLPERLKIIDSCAPTAEFGHVDRMRFGARIGVEAGEGSRSAPRVERFCYDSFDGLAKSVSVVFRRRGADPSGYEIRARRYRLTRRRGHPLRHARARGFHGFDERLIAGYQNGDFLRAFSAANERFLKSIIHHSGLRALERRTYDWDGAAPADLGPNGEDIVAAILTGRARRGAITSRVKTGLKKLSLADELKVEPIPGARGKYRIKVRARGSGAEIDLSDAGSGVARGLALLTRLLRAAPKSTLILDRPESALHPSSHGKLAELFIDLIKTRSGAARDAPKLLIETDSELLIRRLARAVQEREIGVEKIAIHFVNNSKGKRALEKARFDMFGALESHDMLDLFHAEADR